MNEIKVIVTGSNRGIGKETALALAKNNYTIIMACRNVENAQKVCDEIKKESHNDNVFVLELDLSSIASIKSFAASYQKTFQTVNILINNAGLTSHKYEKTMDGLEKVVGTNYFGTFFLTKLLLPLFEPGKDNRIINMSSDFYKFGRFKINKLNDYHWVKAYAVSKYLILLFTLELAEKLKVDGITVNAVHPGVVKTKIMMTNSWYDIIINLILFPMYINEKEGASTSIYLAQSDELKGITGKYFTKCKPLAIPKKFNDIELRKELWNASESIFQKAVQG